MIRRAVLWVLLLLLCPLAATAADTAESPLRGPYNVGYSVLDFDYMEGGAKKTLTLAAWYPTAAQPSLHTYNGPTKGNVAVGAAPLKAKGPYPFLLFSHGFGGGGHAAVFLTEVLASRGWVVVAPDHNDKYSVARIHAAPVDNATRRGFWDEAQDIADSNPEERPKYLYRLDEMQRALAYSLGSHLLRDVIDTNRIAVGGHSFGGYTALGLCGTIAERYDPRIKAVLLFSSASSGYLYRAEELATVRMPAMLFLGEAEREHHRGERTTKELADKVYTNLTGPKYFLEIKGASHFSFNARLSDTRLSRRLSGSAEEFDVITRYSVAFLESYVAGRKDLASVLEQSDPRLTRFLRSP